MTGSFVANNVPVTSKETARIFLLPSDDREETNGGRHPSPRQNKTVMVEKMALIISCVVEVESPSFCEVGEVGFEVKPGYTSFMR